MKRVSYSRLNALQDALARRDLVLIRQGKYEVWQLPSGKCITVPHCLRSTKDSVIAF